MTSKKDAVQALKKRILSTVTKKSKPTKQDADMVEVLSLKEKTQLLKFKAHAKGLQLAKYNRIFQEQFGMSIPFDVRLNFLGVQVFDFQKLLKHLQLYNTWQDTNTSAQDLIKQKYGDAALQVVNQVMEVY